VPEERRSGPVAEDLGLQMLAEVPALCLTDRVQSRTSMSMAMNSTTKPTTELRTSTSAGMNSTR